MGVMHVCLRVHARLSVAQRAIASFYKATGGDNSSNGLKVCVKAFKTAGEPLAKCSTECGNEYMNSNSN